MDQANVAFATSMTSIALAFASISLLSRGNIAKRLPGTITDNNHHIHGNLAEIKKRKMPGLYMWFFIIAEVACNGLGWYSYSKINQLVGKNIFSKLNTLFLVVQLLSIVYTVGATFNKQLRRHRWWTFGACLAVPMAIILVFMIWAHSKGNVGINFGDWSYGQTFNGAAGIAGFATTLVDWLTSEDSAVDTMA
jgi:hypothetical protein